MNHKQKEQLKGILIYFYYNYIFGIIKLKVKGYINMKKTLMLIVLSCLIILVGCTSNKSPYKIDGEEYFIEYNGPYTKMSPSHVKLKTLGELYKGVNIETFRFVYGVYRDENNREIEILLNEEMIPIYSYFNVQKYIRLSDINSKEFLSRIEYDQQD